jgi:hypothetical protein
MAEPAVSGAHAVQQSEIWSALPSLFWTLLVLIALLVLRKEIRALLENLSWRVRTGAALKLFSIELGASYVSPSIDARSNETALQHRPDAGDVRYLQRQQYYKPNRNVHLVHRLAPSKMPRMLYDVQLYLIAHEGATLANVSRVEYYFGKHWGSQIFTSIDRAQAFPISTSAFGPFMCTAALQFSDGETVMINRYVDFEMGAAGTKA